jgi:plasmid stability protein
MYQEEQMTEKISYKMNLPADIDRWIRIEAATNCRSRSGEIIRILKERMETAENEKAGSPTTA